MATVALASTSADAASIGVNVGPNVTANTLATTDVAGVVAQDNWNNKLGNGNLPATTVTDDSGTLLATTVSTSGQWGVSVGNGVATGDGIMMNGSEDGGTSTVLSATVTGIPYAVYDVYFYFDGNQPSGNPPETRAGTYTVGGIAQQGTDLGSPKNFAGTFFLDDGVGGGGNYLLYSGLTSPNITLSSVPINVAPTDRAPWNGFQIVEATVIPEPSTALLAAIGLFGLMALRRRRRR